MKIDETTKLKSKMYISVAIVVILFYFTILRLDDVQKWLSDVFEMLSPFIIGIAFAFLLDKPMMGIQKMLMNISFSKKLARTVAAVAALFLGIFVVVCFCALIGPQLWDSLMSLIDQAPTLINSFYDTVVNLFEKNNIQTDLFNELFNSDFITNLINNVTTYVTQTIPQLFALGGKVTSVIFDVLIGLVAGLYIMLEKELFMKALKSMTYAFLPKSTADYLTRFANITKNVFNDFIIGKAIDSLIIGILTYVVMSIFKMPYALLLSTIVGVTNMIPVFGPFIGAVPGIFILTILDFKLGLTFAMMILAIQQLDGNVIGPIILGDKLGLPSLAILFSVSVGGGLFGIVGMFIGVPIFAIIYTAIKEVVEYQLKKKNIELS